MTTENVTWPEDLTEEHYAYRDAFLQGYAEATLWANTYDIEDIDRTVEPAWWQSPVGLWAVDAFDPNDGSRDKIYDDCDDFLAANWADLRGIDAGQAGHDFALTRNRHGAGFWDRGLGEVGERLTEAAHVYGSVEAWCRADDDTDTFVHID